jgi:hypothetical protein
VFKVRINFTCGFSPCVTAGHTRWVGKILEVIEFDSFSTPSHFLLGAFILTNGKPLEPNVFIYLHIALMMEAVRISETSVNFSVTIRRYIP